MIEAAISPLRFLRFHLLESDISFVNPEKKTTAEERRQFSSQYKYEIDLDFGEGENNTFATYIDLQFNFALEPELPGYSVSVSAFGTFRIEESAKLNESARSNLVHYSTANYMIGRLRDHIYQVTALSVWGPFTLPSIDIKDLLDRWFAQKEAEAAAQAKKASKKRKP